jgi:hypothetical protein
MGVAPSSRCLTNFKILMKRYMDFLNELSLLIDHNTSDEFMVKLEEAKDAVRMARTKYWFYPWMTNVGRVNSKFNALRRTFPTRDFIPQERNVQFVQLASELEDETTKLNELYTAECNGSLLLGCAAGFFDYFLVDVLLANFEFLTETVNGLKGYANIAKNYAAAKLFAISAISKGLDLIGFSPVYAALAAPVVLSALIATCVFLIAIHVFPTACRDITATIWQIMVIIGLAPAQEPVPLLPVQQPPV